LKAWIVIPTYNERENIQKLIPEIENVLREEELNGNLLIVDDDSPDGTGEVAEQMARKFGNIKVLYRRKNLA